MKNSVLNPPAAVELDPLRKQVWMSGTEAGLNGVDWSPQLEPALRSELKLMYLHHLPLGSVVSPAHLERLRKRQELLDARRASALKRLAARSESGAIEAGVMWRLRWAVATASLLGIVGLAVGCWATNLGPRGWGVLVLVWVLLQTRPWGLAEKFHAAGKAFTAAVYLFETLRSELLARCIFRAESASEQHALRREQCQDLQDKQLEFLLSQFQFAKARGDRARLTIQEQQS